MRAMLPDDSKGKLGVDLDDHLGLGPDAGSARAISPVQSRTPDQSVDSSTTTPTRHRARFC